MPAEFAIFHDLTSLPEHLIQNIMVSMRWDLLQDASLLI